ncbi:MULTISPECIES: DUF5665 domain-containing protein [Pacificibacter]|uniref:DUF5665 domain-containing protein n=1 Tax=Pacificibacter TaxID=1042323 RepID=UPI001C095856|nr:MULTISPECIES: DUF5665 domain-containing protein [Pacificibacter]MBU2935987.1 hypothetical protein [Pacificibacter marinus]MDO6615164.1 DUF5665 domain-containing protein [Pacificibacter sp. 1_MG-2023]
MSDLLQNTSNDIEKLSQEVARLNAHRFIRLHDSTWRLMWFNFLRGLAFGFGSVAGATIVVSIVGYILNQIEVVPIIGEWAKQIAAEIMIDTTSTGGSN